MIFTNSLRYFVCLLVYIKSAFQYVKVLCFILFCPIIVIHDIAHVRRKQNLKLTVNDLLIFIPKAEGVTPPLVASK